jgi:hypothetical protein
MHISNGSYSRCTAHVTLKRGRVKEYAGRQVYLKDGQEFEIELFNPHQTSFLAKIYINGVSISTQGLVLRPGQRAYLERYLDVDKKFKFSTYEVENSREAMNAIQNNGDLKVEFYPENQSMIWRGNTITVGNQWGNYWTYTNSPVGGSFTVNNTNSLGSLNLTGSTSALYSSVVNDSNSKSLSMERSVETGRVEAGEKSNQTFHAVNESFSPWASEIETIKILPISLKPIEVSEIRNYCTSCGTRMKKTSWKFCPSCGTKIEG